ncbi:MAG: phosphoribosylanthranilate isomerase [Candidatus Omnitrophica bacterium]|nr:phosphoribosylanthranilate isomerase [Candidatus Omnitrophota bacterium]
MVVKICGLTNYEDASKAVELGADLLGFLFAKESPRYTEPCKVKKIIQNLPEETGKAGLFKNEDIDVIVDTLLECSLTHVQLHGNESPVFCINLKSAALKHGKDIIVMKTFKVGEAIMWSNPLEYEKAVNYFLFDTYHPKMMGGTGLKFDWDVLKNTNINNPYFLAGGLDPKNVGEAIRTLNPYGVDIASGVEAFVGKKDHEKLKEFIYNAKNA